MSAALLVLSLFLGDDPATWAVKARARVLGAPFYQARFTWERDHVPGAVQGTVSHKLPLQQRVTVVLGDQNMEMLQTQEGVLALDHQAKRYYEYFPAPVLLPPPPHGLLEECLPPPLYSDIRDFGQVSRWKVERTGLVSELSIVVKTAGGNTIHFAVSVDSGFVMRKCVMTTQGANGPESETWTVTEDSLTDQGQGLIADVVPQGYVPAVFAKSPGLITPGLKVVTEDAPDARGGKPIRLWSKGKPGVIVFTSPDCAASGELEQTLRELRPKVEALGGTLVEVSTFGPAPDLSGKDPARAVGHDTSGDIGRHLRYDVTPYVIVCDRNGVMVRGFAGFAPDQKEHLTQTVLDAVKSTQQD